jgi:hypothetical protein
VPARHSDPLTKFSHSITVVKFVVFEILMFLMSLYGMYELAKAKFPFLANLAH